MDKSITKVLVETAGVRQAKYYLALRHDFERGAEGVVRAAAEQLGSFPVFVKPCSQGSSVGVAKANNMLELAAGLTEAFALDDKVLVEEFIDGHEVECAVLGNREPVASTVGEIAPTPGIFIRLTQNIRMKAPSCTFRRISPSGQIETVRRNALRVYRALGCRGLALRGLFCHPCGWGGRVQRAEFHPGLYLDQQVPQAVRL